MIENINDFMSIALLVGFFVGVLFGLLVHMNNKRIRKHIEEEYYYYNDSDDVDDEQ